MRNNNLDIGCFPFGLFFCSSTSLVALLPVFLSRSQDVLVRGNLQLLLYISDDVISESYVLNRLSLVLKIVDKSASVPVQNPVDSSQSEVDQS
jgi:hypothetical protein